MKYLAKLPIIIFLFTSCFVWANDEEKAREIRDRNLKRMQGMAGHDSNTPKNNDQGYAQKIRNSIKPNIAPLAQILEAKNGPTKIDLRTVIEIRCNPDGLITHMRIIKPSAMGVWDATVIYALVKTKMIPLDSQDKVPPILEISFDAYEK
jgi:colicin import membrane protein